MRLSLNLTNSSWAGPAHGRLTEVARAADAAGIDTLWVPDHLIQADPTRTADADMLEAYTTLGFLASATARVRLGTLVSAVTYRAPALLVKAVTTLDVLSDGRAWLGIGAGYAQAEAQAMGLDLPAVKERMERLEDTLRLAHQMWRDDPSPFLGRHASLSQPIGHPLPVSRPHPPILVGGMGEHRTLRLVAAYGDACNLFDIPDGGATIRRKLAVLARHCDEASRDLATIDRTVSTRWAPSEPATGLVARCRALGALGLTHAVLMRTEPWTPDDVEALSRVLPDIAAA
jgi:F420-dependent oxidoreductase-like protein